MIIAGAVGVTPACGRTLWTPTARRRYNLWVRNGGGGRVFAKRAHIGSGCGFALPRSASAELSCRDFSGYRVCSVGVTIGLNTARQRCPEWCWAACVEVIFAFNDHKVSQQRIVEKVFGRQACAPAVGPQIVSAIK